MKRALAISVLLSVASPARALVDNDPATIACSMKGKTTIAAPLFLTASGGSAVLTLSNHERTVEVSELPADAASGRLRVRARRDVPGVRVDGYIAGRALTISSRKEISIVPGHVSLRAGASLRLFQSASDLQGEVWDPPIAHARGRVECGELQLGTTSGGGSGVKAEGYYFFRNKSTSLLDAPGGKTIFTVELLWDRKTVHLTSIKQQGAFLRVDYSGEVKLNGWVRAADLEEQAGELGALGGLAGMGTGGWGSSAPVRAAKYDTEIYLGPSATGPAIAILEKGARVWATPVANGFSTIRIIDRDALPPDGKDFHVLTTAVQ